MQQADERILLLERIHETYESLDVRPDSIDQEHNSAVWIRAWSALREHDHLFVP